MLGTEETIPKTHNLSSLEIGKEAREKRTQSVTEKEACASKSEIRHPIDRNNEKGADNLPFKNQQSEQDKTKAILESLTTSVEKEADPLSELETMAKNLLARPEVIANARVSSAWSEMLPGLQPSDLREYQVVIGSQDNKSERFIITSVPGLVKNERCIMIRYLDPNTRREHKLDNLSSDLNKWIIFRYKGDSPTPIATTTGKVDKAHYEDKTNKNWQQSILEENAERFVNYTSWDQLKPEEINDLLSKFKQAQERNIKLPENFAKCYGDIYDGKSQLHEALMGNNPYSAARWDLLKYEIQDMREFLNGLFNLFVFYIGLIPLALKNPGLTLEKIFLKNLTQEEIDKLEKLNPTNLDRFLSAEKQALVQNVNYDKIFKFCNDLLEATTKPEDKAFLTQKNITHTLLHSQSPYNAITLMEDRKKLFELIDKARLMPTFSQLTHMQKPS
jgi:hypothetical protein